jgi:hypothetical protein
MCQTGSKILIVHYDGESLQCITSECNSSCCNESWLQFCLDCKWNPGPSYLPFQLRHSSGIMFTAMLLLVVRRNQYADTTITPTFLDRFNELILYSIRVHKLNISVSQSPHYLIGCLQGCQSTETSAELTTRRDLINQ